MYTKNTEDPKNIQETEFHSNGVHQSKYTSFKKYVSDNSLRDLPNSRLRLYIQISQLYHTDDTAFYDWLHKNIQCNGWNWKALCERNNNNKGFEVSRFESRCLTVATTSLFIQETRQEFSVCILLPFPLQPGFGR